MLGAQRFDSLVFGISPAEAGAMDPQQRLLLELGYVALHGFSHRRVTLMGGDSGVFLGIERPDWASICSSQTSVYAVTGDNISVAAGRVSFVLGLQGPCASVDTACSSALTAMHASVHALNSEECGVALATAASLKLVPFSTLAAASAGMLSVDGRCKTLDARANGYVRSEGIGSLVLCPAAVAPSYSQVVLARSAVRQDGRSASLTAPNGSAQRALFWSTLRRSACMLSEISVAEAHGTGTALGDPTEAGSILAVYGANNRATPLAVYAAKASLGHSEAVSGQVGMLSLHRLLQDKRPGGNTHLRSLNPLIAESIGRESGSRIELPVQQFSSLSTDAACVSSFGYSGTIAHAHARFALDGVSASKRFSGIPASLHRRTFGWKESCPSQSETLVINAPLLGSLSASSPSDLCWEHTLTPEEFNFFRCHRVGLVPLLPGTCYIEFVRVVVVALHGLQLYSLDDVAFHNIMFLDDDAQLFGLPLVRLRLDRSLGAINLTSKRSDNSWVEHADMLLKLRSDASMVQMPLDSSQVQAQCVDTVLGERFYAGTGNDYRGEFRALEQGWAGQNTCLSLTTYEQDETRCLHLRACAFLDACSHMALWWQQHERRPFFAAGVESYNVSSTNRSFNRQLWSTITRPSDDDPGGYRVFDSTGECLVHTTGGESGYFAAGWLEERRTRRYAFHVQWKDAVQHSALSPQREASAVCMMGSLPGATILSRQHRRGPLPLASVAVMMQDRFHAMPVFETAIAMVQSNCARRQAPLRLYLLTCGAQAICPADRLQPKHAGAWGFGRSVRSELPSVSVHCVELSALGRMHHDALSARAWAVVAEGLSEVEIACRGDLTCLPRLATIKHAADTDVSMMAQDESCTQLLTGGTGGIGLLTAEWLTTACRHAHVVLTSRSGALGATTNVKLHSSGSANVVVHCCDISEVADTADLAAKIQHVMPPLCSVWHTAGMLADAMLPRQNAIALRRAYAAKAEGASNMQKAFAPLLLEACVYYSSITALVGGAAQANYAGANACLDAMSAHRRAQGCAAASIEWGPWADVGMAAGEAVSARMGAMGLGLIDAWQGISALEAVTQHARPAISAFWILRWEVMLGQGKQVPPLLEQMVPRNIVAARPPESRSDALTHARSTLGLDAVLEIAQRTAGSAVDADAPLAESGLDSLGAVELRNLLQQAVGEAVTLPSSLLADYPTVRQIAMALQPSTALGPDAPSEQEHQHSARIASDSPPAEIAPTDLTTLSTRLGNVFSAAAVSEQHPSFIQLRPALSEGDGVKLVIMHSFLGDESGYERLWRMSLADRSVYAIRHQYLADGGADILQQSATTMLSSYAAMVVAMLQVDPFDLIGASYGSLVAYHLVGAARALDAMPRRLVLIDPFPFFPRIRETAPMSTLLSTGANDPRSAAHFVLKLRLYAHLGREDGEAMLAQLIEELEHVPNDAVGLFLAAQSMPANASHQELLVQALSEHRRVMTVASCGATITELVESMPSVHARGRAEAVLMVLASERMTFFEDVYGCEGLEDRLDLYGASEPICVEGAHFDIVTGCISNRVPEFTRALESFVSAAPENDDGGSDVFYECIEDELS